MICVDGDGRIVLVNAQIDRLFGYGRNDWPASRWRCWCPRSPGRASRSPGRYVADPRPRPMGAGKELAGRRRDGSTFPAEISLSAIDTDQGILVSAAVRDVTERRMAAEAAAQLASIIQSSHDAVIGRPSVPGYHELEPGRGAAERVHRRG